MPRNIVGPPVQGDDLFGREGFLQDLEERLRQGSVLLLAPRRWGKTSVLRAMRDRDAERRHYFDLYRLERASDFVAEVAATLARPLDRVRKWVGKFLGGALDRVKKVQVAEVAVELRERLAAGQSWRESGAEVLASVPTGQVLIFDEFPVMAKAILDRDAGEGAALLRWLRTERQREGAASFVFAGSTSLSELCRQAGLSDTINDLQLLPLPPFDRKTASELLEALFAAEGVPLGERCWQEILELVGHEVPFFLQLLSSALIAAVRDGQHGVTPGMVRRVYREVLLGADYRAYLDDYRGRLDRGYRPGEQQVAVVVLSALSRQRRGLELAGLRNEVIAKGADEGLLEKVLALLEGDFYVRQEEGRRYRFVSRYLADWWERFHG